MNLGLILGGLTLICIVIGGFWALTKLLMAQTLKQLDMRFAAQESERAETKQHWELRFNQLETLTRKNDTDMQTLREKLPAEYVRREDWIRFSVSIDHKIDAINQSINVIRDKLHA